MYEGLETDWERLKTKWDVVKEISDKVPVDDDFIYEEFDIPKPENYEDMKEQMRRDKEMQSFGFGGYDNDRVITAPADDKPRSFLRRLNSFFRRSSFKRSDWECPHE